MLLHIYITYTYIFNIKLLISVYFLSCDITQNSWRIRRGIKTSNIKLIISKLYGHY